MIPIPWLMILYFLVIWLSIGGLAGLCGGIALRLVTRKRLAWSTVDLFLSLFGALGGVFVSGWASLQTYNAGAHHHLLWDPDGRLIDWRTLVAENRGLDVVICAVIMVILWHVGSPIVKRVGHG
jgi:hypothetical protein